MADTVFNVLRKTIQEHENMLVDTISAGGVASFDEYKKVCGEIQGLRYALREINGLEQRHVYGDEDDG